MLGAFCLLANCHRTARRQHRGGVLEQAEVGLLQVKMDSLLQIQTEKKESGTTSEGALAPGHGDVLSGSSPFQSAQAELGAGLQASGGPLPAKLPGSIDRAWLQKALGFGLLVGGVFGMMGAGGSMILKPVLYYGFGVQPFREAIFHGYVILVTLAAAAALKGHVRGLVCWRLVAILLSAMGFGSMLGSYQASLVSNSTQVWAFAVVLLGVSLHMVLKSMGGGGKSGASATNKVAEEPESFFLTPKMAVMGVSAGLLSGFMGVGGGFILVPVLSELGLDMERAVPTSQAVVSLSALLGFCYYMLFMGYSVWQLNAPVTAALTCTGLLGIAVSGVVAARLTNALRQRTFAGMLGVIAVGMMAGQIRA